MLHFVDNEIIDTLYKLRFVIEALNDSFQQFYTPGADIYIDKMMVPWHGRLSFRQYIPSKRYKYGADETSSN